MKVSGKVIVVTGAANGMGKELVLQLLKKGASVAAIDLRQESLQALAEECGPSAKLSLHVCNITNHAAVKALPEAVVKAHGQVDGVINNAGIIQPFVRINELDFQAIERVMHVNFYGLVYMTKAFLPYLLKRPEAHVVNTSSMGGFLPVPGQSVYGASKAAVKLFTEGLRSELLDTAVRVTIVFPGAIGTNIAQNSGVGATLAVSDAEQSKFKMLPADKAAAIILQAMERNAYRVLVGSDAKFMDFLYRLHPKFAAEFIYKQMKTLLK
jgi:short-subunit dehydrogenase